MREEISGRSISMRILLAIFSAVIMLVMAPGTVHASNEVHLTSTNISNYTTLSEGTYILDENISFSFGITVSGNVILMTSEYSLTGAKATGNPGDIHISSGSSLTVEGSGELACTISNEGELNSRTIISGNVINVLGSGVINSDSGTFTGKVKNYNVVNGGVFKGDFENYSVINGGVFQGNVTKGGTRITGGVFHGDVNTSYSSTRISAGAFYGDVRINSSAIISGGTFESSVTNEGKIIAGSFNNSVKNYGSLSDGFFKGTVDNYNGGKISGGTFTGNVNNNHGSEIKGGNFSGTVNNEEGVITDGTFSGNVINGYTINGGTFTETSSVTNNGYINNGTFNGSVNNESGGTINGGTFCGTVTNNGGTIAGSLYWTVMFESSGGTDVNAQKVLKGQKAGKPSDPLRSGYTFDRWYYGDTEYDFNSAVTTDLTLRAKWTPITYTVKFDANGGMGTMSDQTMTYDKSDELAANTFTNSGNTFAGWKTSIDGSAHEYTDGAEVKNLASEPGAVVMLYAHWATNTYKITYSYEGDVPFGAPQASGESDGAVGTEYDVDAAPEFSGYTFSGWKTASSDVTVSNGKFTMPDHDVTFTGTWTKNADPTPTPTPTPSPSPRPTPRPSNPTYRIPVSSDHGSVTVTATVSGSTASVEVSDSAIERVIADHAGTVVIDLSSLRNVTSAKIPSHVVDKTHTSENTGLRVNFYSGSVSFDETALESVNTGKELTVSIETVRTSGLSSAQKDAIGTKATLMSAVDVRVLAGNVEQDGFGGGRLTISFSFTPGSNVNTDRLAAWYVKPDGRIENRGGHYDSESKIFTFETDHLSRYILVEMPASGKKFDDVSDSAWYAAAVDWASRKGITSGTGDTTFSPDDSCTRAQMATFLWRAAGSPEVKDSESNTDSNTDTASNIDTASNFSTTSDFDADTDSDSKADSDTIPIADSEQSNGITKGNIFTDVPDDQYYSTAVKWAAANGITSGIGNGLFGPNETCTREQFVTFLYRFAQYKGMNVSVGEDTNILSYSDIADVAEYAIPAFQWACGDGTVYGGADNNLMPKDDCTRAQSITMLYRMLGE